MMLNKVKASCYNVILGMKQNEYLEDGKTAAQYFETEIKKLFPDANQVIAKVTTNLGNSINYYYIGDEYKVTRHNAKYRLEFTCWLDGKSRYNDVRKGLGENDKFEIELHSWSSEWKGRGLKYRKITGKTPMEATKKLIDWFKKNKEAIQGET